MKKTNKQLITFLASRMGLTLEQLVYGYFNFNEIKVVVDKWLDDVNSRRVPNGWEKGEITFDLLNK